MLTKIGSCLTPIGDVSLLPYSCDHENSMASLCITGTASALPEGCEGLYSAEVVEKDKGAVAVLTERLSWIQKLFWYVASGLFVLIMASATWYLPHELSGLRRDINADTAGQLKPLNDKMISLDVTLRMLRIPGNSAAVLKELSSLDPAEFAQNLPVLKKITEQLTEQTIASPETLQRVASNFLQTQSNVPGYWPSALRFLQYASLQASPGVPPPGAPRLIFSHNINLSLSPIENTVVKLDGGSITNITFRNSRIIFTEDMVQMKNVTFINCVFELPISDQPTPYIQRAARVLLAENLQDAVIRSL